MTTRDKIEENYPNYSKIKLSNENFNEYLEKKLNDGEFVENIFENIFEK